MFLHDTFLYTSRWDCSFLTSCLMNVKIDSCILWPFWQWMIFLGLSSTFDKIKVSFNHLINKYFSSKLEISFQTYSIDPNNHLLSKRDKNYSYQFSFSVPQTTCEKHAVSSRCVQKKVSCKNMAYTFFLGALEVKALKPKYEMESVDHKILSGCWLNPQIQPSRTLWKLNYHREKLWTNIFNVCAALKTYQNLFRRFPLRAPVRHNILACARSFVMFTFEMNREIFEVNRSKFLQKSGQQVFFYQ